MLIRWSGHGAPIWLTSGARADDPRVAPPVRRVPLLGPEHRGLLLCLADEHNAFGALEALQSLGHHIVLALPRPELHHLDLVLSGITFQLCHETPAHRRHQRRGGEGLLTVTAKEPGNVLVALQGRHVNIEVHPVDPLDRQGHVITQYLRNALCYHCPGSGRSVLPERAFNRSRGPLGTGSTRARHEPATGATVLHLVGLRRSLVSTCPHQCSACDAFGRMPAV